MNAPTEIVLSKLQPHPQNPRLEPRQDVVDQIAAQIRAIGSFDPAHALIVRRLGEAYQIISGHHRRLAGEAAGLATIPCWVRELSDADAYMALVLANTQGELSALERGTHALHSGMDVKAYAEAVGRANTSVHREVCAARVAATVPHMGNDLIERTRQLAEIHAAPSWLWPALAAELVARGWTVEATRGKVAALKDAPEPAAWGDGAAIAEAVVSGAMKPAAIVRMAAVVANAKIEDDDLKQKLTAELTSKRPGSLSQAQTIVGAVEDEQAERTRASREARRLRQEVREAADHARAARREALLNAVSLEQWAKLDAEECIDVLGGHGETGRSFNKQDNADIEWAQWSWNPVTGCLHDCPYCYARDIALQKRMAEVYPNGFAPTLKPRTLLAPRGKKPPKVAETDTRYRNVFTCSMADLFGRWVPEQWINAVLGEIAAAPDWNFLCLTKFPKRMAEFEIPANAWMGTTVDLQARVAAAEAGFAKVRSGVRWLSIEPLIEPLRFKRLDLFQWMVIGGASRSSKTPPWRPPFEWVADLVRQAREAGVRVYFKTNLLGCERGKMQDDFPLDRGSYIGGNRILELPFDAPIKADPVEAPAIFHYLGGRKDGGDLLGREAA